METQKSPQGISPDSGRKKWKIMAPQRCPSCNVLVAARATSCPACNQLLYCPRKSYRFKIIAAASFLALIYLLVFIILSLILEWINSKAFVPA